MTNSRAILATAGLVAVAHLLTAVMASDRKEPPTSDRPAQQHTRYGIGYEYRKTDRKQSNLTSRERHNGKQPPLQQNGTAENR